MTEPAHAKLSPSSAAKWLTCTAAPGLEDTLPPEEESVYAAEGTFWHAWGEIELQARLGKLTSRQRSLRQTKLRKSEEGAKFWSRDGVLSVQSYVDSVMEVIAEMGDDFVLGLVEVRVQLTEWVPGSFGTADCVLIGKTEIHVLDLKMGQGVPVSAYRNPQAMLYALGACFEFGQVYDFEKVSTTIIQPRLHNISTYTLSVDELLEWGEEVVKPAALAASTGEGAEFVPSDDACRWCVAKAVCVPRMNAAVEDDFGDLTDLGDFTEPSAAKTLSLEALGAILTRLPEIKSWVKDVEAYTLAQAKAGETIPGWKLVSGKSSRKIVDPVNARGALADAGLKLEEYMKPRELKPLGELEKLLGGADKLQETLGESLQKPEGAPTLVVESDRRPALGTAESAAEDFTEPVEVVVEAAAPTPEDAEDLL